MPDDVSTPTPETQTILGIRLEPALREKIKALAAADGRTESGFARYHLARIVEEEEARLQFATTEP
jgi:predicted transcriptional regulator